MQITFFLLLIFYSEIGFFYLDINSQSNKLIDSFILYSNIGVRSGGGIGDILPKISYYESGFFLRFLTDMMFYLTIILLLLNMINGVIISTFSELRQIKDNKDYIIENVCLICGRDKSCFEDKQISFKTHCSKIHNIYSYMKYFIILNKNKSTNDLSFYERQISEELVNNRYTSIFPDNFTVLNE